MDWKVCMSTHSYRDTLTLNSKNSGLIKSSRNQVSGGFSQSAIALVNKTRKRWEGVNIHLCHTFNQYTDSIIWGLKKRGTSWPIAVNYNNITEWSLCEARSAQSLADENWMKRMKQSKQWNTSTRQTPVIGLEVDHGEGKRGTRACHIYVYSVTLLESSYSHLTTLVLSLWTRKHFISLVVY